MGKLIWQGWRAARLALWAGLLVSLNSCQVPIKVIRVTPAQRAREAITVGDAARKRGNLESAAESYQRAWQQVPHEVEAWLRWRDVTEESGWGEARRTLQAWAKRQPHDTRVNFLLGLFAVAESQRWDFLQKSWQGSVQSGSVSSSWVLRSDAMRPAAIAGWQDYVRGLESLEPRNAALDLALGLGYWELRQLGSLRQQRDRLQSGTVEHAMLAALVKLEGDDVPGGERALRKLLATHKLPSPARSFALRLALTRVLRKRESAPAQERLQDLQRGREFWSVSASDIDILESMVLSLQGERRSGYRLLLESLPRCFSPRLRVQGTLLLQTWEAELSGSPGTPPESSRWALKDAPSWTLERRELEQIFNTAIRVGAPVTAADTLERLAALWPDAQEVPRWRQDETTLRELAEEPTLAAEAWHFFVSSSIQRRQKTLREMPEELRSRVLARTVRLTDTTLRLVALHSLRDKMLIPFEQLPAQLSTDADPRVRASWILLAARAGGNVARDAIVAGRKDADEYVRQVAHGLKLPQEK